MIALDSSAILAVLFNEPGWMVTQAALDAAIMSTVNIAEVYTKAYNSGLGQTAVNALFARRTLEVVPLSLRQAQLAGELWPITRAAGLSLGDRCCLALAIDHRAVALTADRGWMQFAETLGVEVRLIR